MKSWRSLDDGFDACAQACMNLFYPYNRGALCTALIVLYSLTAGIAGYVAASYYKQVKAGAKA